MVLPMRPGQDRNPIFNPPTYNKPLYVKPTPPMFPSLEEKKNQAVSTQCSQSTQTKHLVSRATQTRPGLSNSSSEALNNTKCLSSYGSSHDSVYNQRAKAGFRYWLDDKKPTSTPLKKGMHCLVVFYSSLKTEMCLI